jgi:hypothetical protein
MAEILDSFKFEGVGQPSHYRYDEWFDGQIWKLEQGVDFNCQPSSLRQTFYSAARRKGLTIRASVLPNNDVVVQRID